MKLQSLYGYCAIKNEERIMRNKIITHTQLTESKLDDLDQVVCKMIRAGNFGALDILVKATRTDREFVLS